MNFKKENLKEITTVSTVTDLVVFERGNSTPKRIKKYIYDNKCKKYVGVLNQAGTDTPTVTVLVNTIGTITLERVDVGEYSLFASEGTFTENRTVLIIGHSNAANYSFLRVTDSELSLTTNVLGTPADDCLTENSIIIEIYE